MLRTFLGKSGSVFGFFPKTGFAQYLTLQFTVTIQPNGKVTNSYNQHDVRGGGGIIAGSAHEHLKKLPDRFAAFLKKSVLAWHKPKPRQNCKGVWASITQKALNFQDNS